MGAPKLLAIATNCTAVLTLLMNVGSNCAVACVTSKYLDKVF